MTSTVPLLAPKYIPSNVNTVQTGQSIPPIIRLRFFSASDWEDFILEWAGSLREKYWRVERCGGAGDMGRDVIAFVHSEDDSEVWDNYQCKHYNHPLRPSDIWLELGKLIYYTHINKFTCPRKYYFVAPQAVGTALTNLFRSPDNLRQQLLANWDKYCKRKITSKVDISLDDALKKHIHELDFSIFGYLQPLEIIEQHARTRYHVSRFGGGLPERPSPQTPPDTLESKEARYISKLMEAYGDHLQRDVTTLLDIETEHDLKEHCKDSRIQFFSAESLRSFSRDCLPPGEYQKLQNEIHEGIKDEIREDYPSGYKRVVAVVKTARSLQITSHSLVSKMTIMDRGGICHQLANDKDEISWVKK